MAQGLIRFRSRRDSDKPRSGILPQAIVANIADASSKTTGQDRQGMFYAARTFAMKMGQSRGDVAVHRGKHVGIASGTVSHRHICAAVLYGMGPRVRVTTSTKDCSRARILSVIDVERRSGRYGFDQRGGVRMRVGVAHVISIWNKMALRPISVALALQFGN